MAFVATVLTACGIETLERSSDSNSSFVATVLTACGIETLEAIFREFQSRFCCNSTYRLRYWNKTKGTKEKKGSTLQQYLPFTVLKLFYKTFNRFQNFVYQLQQYLPFTVLKLTA